MAEKALHVSLRSVYSGAFGWHVRYKPGRSIWSIVLVKSTDSSLIFCLDDLSIVASGLLNSPPMIILPFISPFGSVNTYLKISPWFWGPGAGTPACAPSDRLRDPSPSLDPLTQLGTCLPPLPLHFRSPWTQASQPLSGGRWRCGPGLQSVRGQFWTPGPGGTPAILASRARPGDPGPPRTPKPFWE